MKLNQIRVEYSLGKSASLLIHFSLIYKTVISILKQAVPRSMPMLISVTKKILMTTQFHQEKHQIWVSMNTKKIKEKNIGDYK